MDVEMEDIETEEDVVETKGEDEKMEEMEELEEEEEEELEELEK